MKEHFFLFFSFEKGENIYFDRGQNFVTFRRLQVFSSDFYRRGGVHGAQERIFPFKHAKEMVYMDSVPLLIRTPMVEWSLGRSLGHYLNI